MIIQADELRKMAKEAKDKKDQVVADKADKIVPEIMKAIVSLVQSSPMVKNICIDGHWKNDHNDSDYDNYVVMTKVGSIFREAGYNVDHNNYLKISWEEKGSIQRELDKRRNNR